MSVKFKRKEISIKTWHFLIFEQSVLEKKTLRTSDFSQCLHFRLCHLDPYQSSEAPHFGGSADHVNYVLETRDDRRTESRPSPAENCVSPAQPSGSAQASGLGWAGY